tara:strand:+ start:2549 stop:3262 length:714 start_codon:yes stop_codon:yes gene_type:complete
LDINSNRLIYGILLIFIILLSYLFSLEKYLILILTIFVSKELYMSKIYNNTNKYFLLSLLSVTSVNIFLIDFNLKIILFSCFFLIFISIYLKKYENEIFILLNFLFLYSLFYLSNISVDYFYLVILLSFANDTFAYIAGRLLKGPLIIPKISPNKTWTGTSFSFLLSFFILIYFDYPIIISIILSISLFFGDIYFSHIKRINNLKDFSQLLAGHGGILDRIDSMTLFSFIFLISLYL